jgi:hypothetical protein
MEANQEILIESDPSFYMRFNNKEKNSVQSFHLFRYLNIEVLSPCIEEGFNIVRPITPHEVNRIIFVKV